MGDYISRDAAIRAMRGNAEDRIIAGDGTYKGKLVPIKDAAKRIGKLPTADVAPVVHGAWEWYEQWSESNTDHPSGCDDCGWKCSECGSALSDSILEGIGETVYCDSFQDTPKMKVCPNCYARMDGGENHDQR